MSDPDTLIPTQPMHGGSPNTRASTPAGQRTARSSYETGESSNTGSLQNTPNHDASDGTLAVLSSSSNQRSSIREATDGSRPTTKDTRGRRSHKVRSSGGFLLQNTLRDTATTSRESSGAQPRRRHAPRQTPQASKVKSSPMSSEKSGSSAGQDPGHGLAWEGPDHGQPSGSGGRVSGSSPYARLSHDLDVGKRPATSQPHQNGAPAELQINPSPRPVTSQGYDMDSAEIVNMALNLSEARRMASARRVASNAAPPTLAPLPDGGTGGSLRQHLQQQRKTSRNISPRPDKGASPRISSAPKMNSPMQGAFDLTREGSHRYHFSQSTIARAQKAKDHIELMAQYRRLLELVPPLKPEARVRPGTGASSVGISRSSTANSTDGGPKLGRPYDPLQYIRNRKVRARERKGIDGDAQGFGDIQKVTQWVDNVARWAATGQSAAPDTPTLPPFLEADLQAQIAASSTAQPAKQKRPRVDWTIEPADMVADVYWLEQDHHLQLIEDRDWRRIFPKTLDTTRPITSHADKKPDQEHAAPKSTGSQESKQDSPESSLPKTLTQTKLNKMATEDSVGTTRDRARQKLQELRGVRNNSSSGHSHELLRFTRASSPEGSDTDDDENMRPGPRRTYTTNNKDILEKQMLAMAAREAGQSRAGSKAAFDTAPQPFRTPERQKSTESQVAGPTAISSRKQSSTDISDLDDKTPPVKAHSHPVPQHYQPGRPSLDIPSFARHPSLDLDHSYPNSPDQNGGNKVFAPTIGGDLSPPPTRSGSPSRNPFQKVKSIFRERSRDRGGDLHSGERNHENDEPGIDAKGVLAKLTESPSAPGRASLEHKRSRSPPPKKPLPRPSRQSSEVNRVPTRKQSGEPTSKGLFKGARIDTVLRGGVSKLGDLLWRKDSELSEVQPDAPFEDEDAAIATDESDAEPSRGRTRRADTSLSRTTSTSTRDRDQQQSRAGKNYLDVMPTFRHVSHDKMAADNNPVAGNVATPTSPGRSSRFELLKPPRIDVAHPSPSLEGRKQQPRGPKPEQPRTNSREESRSESRSEGVREADRRLSSIISMPPSFNANRRHSSLATNLDSHRHWSISARSPSPQRAPVSKREVARLRALVLSSGIMAMEISRRAHEAQPVFAPQSQNGNGPQHKFWPSIAQLDAAPKDLQARAVPQTELFQVAGDALSSAIENIEQDWQRQADDFSADAAPALHARVEAVRRHVAVDLSAMTRAAADEADETNRDLAHGQRLKIKQVVDVIEKMLRRRRRRFRWLRRGLWLGVEWVLVGFMWYVWFVVMIMRVVFGVGRGALGAVKWLLFI